MIVRLLGPPSVVDHRGENIKVRGKKTWGVIARVLLSDVPVSRRRLAEELFATADDPMGALRWALAQIRRSMDDPESFRDDPVDANLGPDLFVDVLHLDRLEVDEDGFPGQLLEGVDAGWSAEFDVWLSVERWRAVEAPGRSKTAFDLGFLVAHPLRLEPRTCGFRAVDRWFRLIPDCGGKCRLTWANAAFSVVGCVGKYLWTTARRGSTVTAS